MKTLTSAQISFLTLVANFGYLTTRELALLAFPLHSSDSAIKAAQKAVTRLRADGWVLARELPYDGQTNAYVLTRAGADALCDHHCGLWFSHGYDLSMGDMHSRRPMIELLSRLAGQLSLEPVGARGLTKDYKELGQLKSYDAALVNADGDPVFGIICAHGFNAASATRIQNLAKRSLPLLIATTNEPRLHALIRCRAKAAPEAEDTLTMLLPPGVVA